MSSLSDDLDARIARALGAILRSLMLVLPLILLAAALAPGTRPAELLALGGIFGAVVVLFALYRRGHIRPCVYALVFSLIAYSTFAGAAYGSVRSVSMLGHFGAVIAGGMFLGGAALVAAAAASSASIGLLIWLENAGQLARPDYHVGPQHWVIYTAVIGIVAAMIYYGRELLIESIGRLRRGERRLDALFRGSPAALIVTRPSDGRVVEINEAYERIFGMRRDDVVGKSVPEIGVWPDAAERERFLATLTAQRRVGGFRARLQRMDGEPFEAQVSAEIVPGDDGPQLISMVVDLSAEIEAREALRESEARLAGIFRSSPGAVVITDLHTGEFIDANAAAERIFGLTVAEARQRGATRTFWADHEVRQRFREKLHAEGRAPAQRVRLQRADGSQFDAIAAGEVIHDGERALLLWMGLDMSAESQALEAQRRSEERFRQAFELSPIGMTITRVSDGRYLALNRADERTLGYTREEMLGHTTLERGVWLSEQDRNRFIEKLRAERTVVHYETRMRDKAGHLVDCAIYAALVELDGEPCVLASTINLTDQKREEALISEVARGVSGETGVPFFRSLVQHLVAATRADTAMVGEIVGGTRVRTLARWSDGAASTDVEYLLAGSPCEVVLAKSEVVVYPDDVATLFPADETLLAGAYRSYVGVPLVDSSGAAIGILNIVSRRPLERVERVQSLFRIFAARAQSELLRTRHDQEILRISRELEGRVRDRTAQLEGANRELEAFSFSVSHDLRAPLRAIDAFSRMLQDDLDGRLDPRQQQMFHRVRSNVQRMGQLIEDLIGLARVSRGEMSLSRVDLSALAAEAVELLRQRDPEREVACDIEAGAEADCDRNLIRIVLDNLIGNAWKFTSRRDAAQVRFGAVTLQDGSRAFFVRDNGAGFDMRYAKRLFSPFQRLHGPTEFEGTGIGLATVQRILARHGGRIWAESEPENGASFYFTLPQAQPRQLPKARAA